MSHLKISLCVVCTLSLCMLVWADDVIPDDECACNHGNVLIPGECSVEFECRVVVVGSAEQTSSGDPEVDDTNELECNN